MADMAASPFWKVFNGDGEYRACTKDVEDAAVLVAFYGPGATIRAGHKTVVWREGAEKQSAAESYDYVATLVYERFAAAQEARTAKQQEWALRGSPMQMNAFQNPGTDMGATKG